MQSGVDIPHEVAERLLAQPHPLIEGRFAVVQTGQTDKILLAEAIFQAAAQQGFLVELEQRRPFIVDIHLGIGPPGFRGGDLQGTAEIVDGIIAVAGQAAPVQGHLFRPLQHVEAEIEGRGHRSGGHLDLELAFFLFLGAVGGIIDIHPPVILEGKFFLGIKRISRREYQVPVLQIEDKAFVQVNLLIPSGDHHPLFVGAVQPHQEIIGFPGRVHFLVFPGH